VIWAVLCIALFVGFDGELSWVPAVLFGLYIYTSIMLWKAVLDREPAPLALMFWLFHTNFLLLPGFSQAFHGTFFWSSYDAYSQEDLLFACLIIITGFLAFSIGTGYAKRKIRRLNVGISDTHFLVQPLKATWLVQLFLMIILAGLAGVILSMGTDFFMSRSSGRMPQSLVEVGLRTTLPRSLGAGVLLFSTHAGYLPCGPGTEFNHQFSPQPRQILAIRVYHHPHMERSPASFRQTALCLCDWTHHPAAHSFSLVLADNKEQWPDGF
jgi:hypothetical protein